MQGRPLVSFILLAYNQEAFVREAVKGAFSQIYDPLEIVLSDDCSTDGTFQIMKELSDGYRGPHQVRLSRNERNLGLSAHVNTAVQISRGDIIIFAGGDDISMPSRAGRSVEILESAADLNGVDFAIVRFRGSCECKCASVCNAAPIRTVFYDLAGLMADERCVSFGASRAIRRRVCDYFGPLNTDSPTEDSTYFLRCLLTGKVAHCTEPLVCHRLHENNLYSSDARYKMDLALIREQYSADIARAVLRRDIRQEDAVKVMASLDGTLAKQGLEKDLFLAKNKGLFFFRRILCRKNMRWKEKLILLRRILVGRFPFLLATTAFLRTRFRRGRRYP